MRVYAVILNDYIDSNKAAWEEAFDNRKPNWGDGNHIRLRSERFAFFDSDMKKIVASTDVKGKHIAQFCCNNGRELLSFVLDGEAVSGTGFDIAENILEQARKTAEKAGISNCTFVEGNILDISDSYHNRFDLIFFTIGAICWIQDLPTLFDKVGKCLKTGGKLLINDGHPFVSMLAFPWEDEYDQSCPNKFIHSYFRKEPWIGNDGMGYMSIEYKSKTFTDFSHTFSDIINALSENGMNTVTLNEYDYDIGQIGTDSFDGKGIPLSYILIAEKT